MCIAPITIYGPQGPQTIGCRECWQCVGQATQDWVGRNIAESKTAVDTTVVTLTYGRDEMGDSDHLHARVLFYSDVQKWLKRIRFAGYKVRFFITGEYGSMRGRTHWHGIMYWQNKVPPFENGKRVNDRWWPHGFSMWEEVRHHDEMDVAKAIRYVCKYLTKSGNDPESQYYLAMSKRPLIGSQFFKERAHTFVKYGLSPQTLEYSFPDVYRTRDGKTERDRFLMRDTTAKLFLDEFVQEWRRVYGDSPIPFSQVVMEHLDPELKRRRLLRGAIKLRYQTNWALRFPGRGAPSADWVDNMVWDGDAVEKQWLAAVPESPPPRPFHDDLESWMRMQFVYQNPVNGYWCYREPLGSEGAYILQYFCKVIGGKNKWLDVPAEVTADALLPSPEVQAFLEETLRGQARANLQPRPRGTPSNDRDP